MVFIIGMAAGFYFGEKIHCPPCRYELKTEYIPHPCPHGTKAQCIGEPQK